MLAVALTALPMPVVRAAAQQTAPPAAIEASKAPRLVIIFRHAEKSGDEKDPNLTPTGFERARKIPELFLGANGQAPRLPHPYAIFATTPSRKSNRPAQTAAPLAAALQEHLDLDFGKDDDEALAHSVLSGKYAGKVVVIFWHHGAIPALAHDFGVAAPPKWSDSTFDQIWEIDYNDGSAHLTTAPEMLLPGDSTH
jgi:broad specificity phosphatase PhoE